jgi:simple sugar transport system ATP-binding protein
MGQVASRVAMRGVAKRFAETVALRDVDFTAVRGEIHGLLGENGAGKTTLMNILSGLYRADRGEIFIEGQRALIRSPEQALRYRIGMVHQHVELIDSFTALENVVLGREGSRLWLRIERHRTAVAEIATRFGLAVELDAEVRRLPIGVQQKVEILKALYRGVDVLILDEPTTMLTPQEVDTLFATLRTLASQGLTVLFITHKIREILANCDRITVMRGGRIVQTLDRGSVDEARLIELMIGQRLAAGAGVAPNAHPGPVALAVHELAVASNPGASGCTFSVAAGEMVGVAGVAGNGQRDLAEAVLGLRRPAHGTVTLGGRDVTRASVRNRLAAGLAYIPEDRLQDGLLPTLTVAENLMLGLHHWAFNGLTFDHGKARELARRTIEEYAVRAPSETTRAATLSGGNIQKLLVARALTLARLTRGVVLVATNPTRGLDVRATEFVRGRLVAFARNGGAVLMISEDLDELLQLCDRILVLYQGRLVGEFSRPEFDPYRIGALMAGTVGTRRV